jgi:hypothetical protein
MSIFFDVNKKKIKTTHFGENGYEDYTGHQDLQRKMNYLDRHEKKDNWNDYMSVSHVTDTPISVFPSALDLSLIMKTNPKRSSDWIRFANMKPIIIIICFYFASVCYCTPYSRDQGAFNLWTFFFGPTSQCPPARQDSCSSFWVGFRSTCVCDILQVYL